MIAIQCNPVARIALALTLSALIHLIILMALHPDRAPPANKLPPLSARLEPLPKIAAKPARQKKLLKPQPAPSARQITLPDMQATQPTDEQPEELPDKQLIAGNDKEETQTDIGSQGIPQASEVKESADKPDEPAPPVHPFPRHAQLTFVAYKGKDLEIGEARHSLEAGDDKKYLIRVSVNTTGIASLFKTYELSQQSSGIITDQGLRPGRYSETKNTSKGSESNEAIFSWGERLLFFSNGGSTPLPEHAQDIISFLYQLPQLLLNKDALVMHISNGRKLEQYQLAVGAEEMIQTRMGRLRALQLHKVSAPGEEGLDIWLGLEYRLLPVKISMMDRKGQISGEMVISEILVADE